MIQKADEATLDLLFNRARTHNGWTERPIEEGTLEKIWNLARMGPTSANSSPARIVFVATTNAKEKLKPALLKENVAKTMTAPVTAIIGYDMEFYEHLAKLYPHTDARSWFAGDDEAIFSTAFRNGSLQGAYFILAARALGLDCAPMSGFDNDMVDAAFFAGTPVKSNFICAIGYGNVDDLYPRGPRLNFEEACRIE